jgi:hypothetical protein
MLAVLLLTAATPHASTDSGPRTRSGSSTDAHVPPDPDAPRTEPGSRGEPGQRNESSARTESPSRTESPARTEPGPRAEPSPRAEPPSRPRAATRTRVRPRRLPYRSPRVLSDVRTIAAPGAKIAIDPRTGRIVVPSAEQRRELSEAMVTAPARRLEVLAIEGGGTLVRLDDRFMMSAMARRDTSGRWSVDCTPDGPRVASRPVAADR